MRGCLCGLALCCLLAASAARAQEVRDVLVKARPGRETDLRSAGTLAGAALTLLIPQLRIYRAVSIQGLPISTLLNQLRSLDCVEYAEPNGIVHAMYVPNDPMYPQQWNLPKVRCEQAWDSTLGSPGVTVAIVDTGIAKNHPDLVSKLSGPGRDFVNNDMDADDDNGHGTACAGLAGAAIDNGVGIASVGGNVRLIGVKVLDASGSGTFANLAAGIVWAADQTNLGVKVINLSLGGPTNSSAVADAVAYAWSKGVVLVGSAGGSGNQTPTYPAALPEVIAVAATDQNDHRASFSSYGDWVDVAAPGVSILTTFGSSGYQFLSGTSFSAAQVSGLAGLAFSFFGSATSNAFVRERIERTSDLVGTLGIRNGRINAHRCLAQIWASVETIVFGSAVGGTLASTYNSDDDRRVIRNGSTFLITQSPVTVEYQGTDTGAAGDRLIYRFEGHASLTGLTLATDVWRVAAGEFWTILEMPGPTTDEAVEVDLSEREPWVDPITRTIRWRVRLHDRTPAFLAAWELQTDESGVLSAF